MYNESDKENQIRYCDIVPGYGFYNIVGDNLAGGIYNIIERIIGFVEGIRR
jgi:hypothetical protein